MAPAVFFIRQDTNRARRGLMGVHIRSSWRSNANEICKPPQFSSSCPNTCKGWAAGGIVSQSSCPCKRRHFHTRTICSCLYGEMNATTNRSRNAEKLSLLNSHARLTNLNVYEHENFEKTIGKIFKHHVNIRNNSKSEILSSQLERASLI
jgi:hypothetical protein